MNADTVAVSATAASHAFQWLLIAVVLLEGFTIAMLIAHRGWTLVTNAPTTNLRIIVSIVLFPGVVFVFAFMGYTTRQWPPEYVVTLTYGAIIAAMGLDVAQYFAKRKTVDKNLPSVQNVSSGLVQPPAVATRSAQQEDDDEDSNDDGSDDGVTRAQGVPVVTAQGSPHASPVAPPGASPQAGARGSVDPVRAVVGQRRQFTGD